jgi:hypothetical protein
MEQHLFVLFFIFSCWLAIAHGYNTGFWYDSTRPPDYKYDSVPYANLTLRILLPYQDGPGQHLVSDPLDPSKSLFVGNTLNLRTFHTQFILDLNYALGIDVHRIYVLNVQRGRVHYSWESSSVVVNFIFLERNGTEGMTLLEAVAELTNQLQQSKSKVYVGTNVTNYADAQFGLQVVTWDMSLRLSYEILVVGGDEVKDGYFLDQGSLGICDIYGAQNYSTYCEFERFFEDDVSRALNISSYRVNILFVKSASLDSVLVYFRIQPPRPDSGEDSTNVAMVNLIGQVSNPDSLLYQGNVTIRVDPTWGVSQMYGTKRTGAPLSTIRQYEYDSRRLNEPTRSAFITPYDRCKANLRCNWGVVDLDQSSNNARFFQRLFERGQLYDAVLFLDFEDWRMGCRGINWNGDIPPTDIGFTSFTKARANLGKITGAHFWPFDQDGLGPTIPAYLTETNQGLVLDRALQIQQVITQQNLVSDLTGRVEWLEENIEVAAMGPILRSRYDVRANLSSVKADFERWLFNEQQELIQLNSSMCVYTAECTILFNTSSLELTGAIVGTGVVKNTSAGTEVAIFTFNSIYLGPEVHVKVVGQRALALLSKTAAIINTTIDVAPGTLGGFPGGGSVARLHRDMLNDQPTPIFICDLGFYCDESRQFSTNRSLLINSSTSFISGWNDRGEVLVSNNVNGPGSASVRVQAFVIDTDSSPIPEVQTITVSASVGQTVAGGFVVKYKNYLTPIIPSDCSANLMKKILEDNLNIISPSSYPITGDRSQLLTKPAGIGAISVSRSAKDDQSGYTWTITFNTAIGNMPQLSATSFLMGIGSFVTTATVVEGNEIGGTFTLKFLGETSKPISATASVQEMQTTLMSMNSVEYAYVMRTDPTNNCMDGLCDNGPTKAHGLQWTVFITSLLDNVSPTSPTSRLARTSAPPNLIIADGSSLSGNASTISISRGTSASYYSPQDLLNVTEPFSLAYGGAGGSYGGKGGLGFGDNNVGQTYNDVKISDLIGGSGGQMSPADLFAINGALGPNVAGKGGAGGGAVEIIAANDLILGTFGKISVKGGKGDHTSGGGAGGGSGGAILLASGSTTIVQGILDVSGGAGGYGGSSEVAGGGGGGGRIAIFADSITVSSYEKSLIADGGACGIYTSEVPTIVSTMDITASLAVPLGMFDTGRIGEIAQQQLRTIFSEIIDLRTSFITVSNTSIPINVSSDFQLPGTYLDVTMSLTLPVSEEELTMYGDKDFLVAIVNETGRAKWSQAMTTKVLTALSASQNDPGLFTVETKSHDSISEVNLNIGGFIVAQYVIDNFNVTTINVMTSIAPDPCVNPGDKGSIYTQAITTTEVAAKLAFSGAEFTNRALFLSNNESTLTPSGTVMEAPFTGNGPTISFPASRPNRVTYYIRIAGGDSAKNTDASKADYGSLFTLISRGEAGLNVSNVIGVFFGGNGLMVGSNFESSVDEGSYLKRLFTIDPYPNTQKWYKVDLRIDWNFMMFNVLLNDTMLAQNLTFSATDIDGVRLSLLRSVQVYYDEIFVGADATLGFTCPSATRKGMRTSAPAQKGWNYESVHAGQGLATYTTMTRHYNFLETGGSIPFDGQGQLKAFQDVYTSEPDGDYAAADTLNTVYAGALSYFTEGARTAKDFVTASQTLASPTGLWTLGKGDPGDGRQFWYTQFNYNSSSATATPSISPYLVGGVAACSTSDLVNWRFEGFSFQYTNLSDIVHRPPKVKPRNAGGGSDYIVVRPKVLFDPVNKMYVMWAAMDYSNANPLSASSTLAMTMVATSPFEDGPFLFRRSFYPDGNMTLDQVPFYNDHVPVLARSYFLTTEYVLPEAMMQPVWESAKDMSGTINYRANYHRAFYDPSYDNFNDIYLQRWRLEDVGYHVICEDRLTGIQRRVQQGEYNDEGFVCDHPRERKITLGQGNPNITSRFVSPNESANSWWRPTSVPAVKAQDWSANYRDGYCGIRLLNDGFSLYDPDLDSFKPVNRSTCSNIADNPVMDSPSDKLIGILKVVLTRRTKYLAMSRLTSDLLDTDGRLSSFEGALTSGYLLGLITQLGQFSFTAGDNIGSTYRFPQRSEFDTAADYKTRFSQYILNINDRASYSLACVIDGTCPVNFKDQINL